MTKPKKLSDLGLPARVWKVRVVVGTTATIHVISRIEPVVTIDSDRIAAVQWEPIEGTEHGDTIGFIRWADVSAITWREAAL